MSKWLSKWLLIGFSFVLFVGCGGGGGGSNSNTTANNKEIMKLNPNTVLIDSNLSTEITTEDNNTELTVSDKFAQNLKVGETISIPVGRDKRFPIGKSGKVESIDIDGNSIKISLSNIGLSDVVDEMVMEPNFTLKKT
jgi:hypothetical protein